MSGKATIYCKKICHITIGVFELNEIQQKWLDIMQETFVSQTLASLIEDKIILDNVLEHAIR